MHRYAVEVHGQLCRGIRCVQTLRLRVGRLEIARRRFDEQEHGRGGVSLLHVHMYIYI